MRILRRCMAIVRKNEKEIIEINNTVRKMMNSFDGFISSWHA